MHDIQIVSIQVDGRVLEQALFRGNMHDIQSVRIEGSHASVTDWRVFDRITGTDLTPYLARVEMLLTPEEGIIARLHWHRGETIDTLVVQDTEIALTALIQSENPSITWEGDVPPGTTVQREEA